MARVNSSFLRRSGVRKAEANALSTNPPATGLAGPGVRTGRPYWDDPLKANSPPCGVRSVSDFGDRPPGRLDLGAGCPAEPIRGHLQLHVTELAVAEHLHRLTLAHRAGRNELGRTDRAAVGEQL